MTDEPIAWFGERWFGPLKVDEETEGKLRQSAYFPGVTYGKSDGTEAPFRMMRSGEIVDQRPNKSETPEP